jgi:hypothetical protein
VSPAAEALAQHVLDAHLLQAHTPFVLGRGTHLALDPGHPLGLGWRNKRPRLTTSTGTRGTTNAVDVLAPATLGGQVILHDRADEGQVETTGGDRRGEEDR